MSNKRATFGAVAKEFAKAYGRGWRRVFLIMAAIMAVVLVGGVAANMITKINHTFGGTWRVDDVLPAIIFGPVIITMIVGVIAAIVGWWQMLR